eukprot:GGOE01010072.1.p2 GENE.GGOE01010072.1~~GGOE01010072.1.p2  ORF type:complete len:284 (-),score=65.42 GGOE01010072.1:868-1719(-)
MEDPLKRRTPGKGRRTRKPKPQFDTRGLELTPMPVYDPLGDPSLKRFFGEKYMHNMLFEAGLIDKDGRILEADKHRSKLCSVEHILAQTEKKGRQSAKEPRYDIPPEEILKLKRLLKSERDSHALVSPSGVLRPKSIQRKREASTAKRLSVQQAPLAPTASSPDISKVVAAESTADEAEPGYASDYTDADEKYDTSNASDVPDAADDESESGKSEDDMGKSVSEKSSTSSKSNGSDSDKQSQSGDDEDGEEDEDGNADGSTKADSDAETGASVSSKASSNGSS